MNTIIDALQNKENALLESPTGIIKYYNNYINIYFLK